MNTLIPNSWLKEFLETKAKPAEIAKYLSLCGPSVERLAKQKKDWIYDIEVTTNRVDCMSIYGIARELSAILPRFGFKAQLKPYQTKKIKHDKQLDIKVINNLKLCHRILTVKLENVKLGPSPNYISQKLVQVGQRPLNNAIDITNYVMWEIGHPTHVFDYDALSEKKIIVRTAKKGEVLTTLDGIKHKMTGGEVVFDNGKGKIIDLPGIMGTKNSVVSRKTKNVLLWIESIDSAKIRYTSMTHAIRSQAAVLNEKNVDPELGLLAMEKAVELFQKVANAKVASKLLDIYPHKPKSKSISLKKEFINARLGVSVSKTDISRYLNSLEFKATWTKDNLKVKIPTFRSHDINTPEDVVEEIARIYGYHKLPSNLMQGNLPSDPADSTFEIEKTIKNTLSGLGANEIYTISLVPENWIEGEALKLKNPMGTDSKFLRTSLMFSLIDSAQKNSHITSPFHLYEMANIYLPKKGKLPYEKLTLAGIFANTDFRAAKGVIETFFESLNIPVFFEQTDIKHFKPAYGLSVSSGKNNLGHFGQLEQGNIYYELDLVTLKNLYVKYPTYVPIPKYPAQIEDLTLVLPKKTKVGMAVQSIKSTSNLIYSVELVNIYKGSHTFRINYQHPKKTLEDREVEKIRNKIIKKLEKKFGAKLKT